MNWNWTGRAQISLNGLDRTSVDWTGLDWTEPDSTSEDWTGRHCTTLDWTVLVWAWLHQTALPWITLESTILNSHCTSLDWSAPNCIPREMKLIKTVVLNLSHNWILTVNCHLFIGLCLKILVFLHWKQKTVKRKKGVEILNTSHCETLSLNQSIRKPPKEFCKQEISDSLEERITLTNDYILPMKC